MVEKLNIQPAIQITAAATTVAIRLEFLSLGYPKADPRQGRLRVRHGTDGSHGFASVSDQPISVYDGNDSLAPSGCLRTDDGLRLIETSQRIQIVTLGPEHLAICFFNTVLCQLPRGTLSSRDHPFTMFAA